MRMEPEDGYLSVLGPDDDDSIMAFTRDGVDCLQQLQLLEEHKERS